MTQKTNFGLVEWCNAKLGAGYVYGTYFGAIITEATIQAKAAQYPKQYTADYIRRTRKWIGKEAGDCVGLIKGYYWYDPSQNKVFYRFEGRPDSSANGMMANAKIMGGKTASQNLGVTWGYLANIPERPGVLVWRDGHIGVYIGNKLVIESRGVDYGVVKTALGSRGWTHWCLCPSIDYVSQEEDDMILKKGVKGQAVYSYQILCKKLGAKIGAFNDMVLKNAVGAPLKTGCDGSFGSTMVTATNELQKKYGEPITIDGLVTDKLYGKLNSALQALETGVPQAEYDKVVKTNQVLTTTNKSLVDENTKLNDDLKETNDELVAMTSDRDKKQAEISGAASNIKELITFANNN